MRRDGVYTEGSSLEKSTIQKCVVINAKCMKGKAIVRCYKKKVRNSPFF
jgi:hypothetical protein